MMTAKSVESVPTRNQERQLNDNIAAYRKIWNCGNHEVKIQRKKNPKYILSNDVLRNIFVIRKNMSSDKLKELGWTLRTNKKIREYALINLVACYKACETKLKKYTMKMKKQKKHRRRKYNIRQKSKNDDIQTITINHESSYIIHKDKSCYLKTNGMEIRLKEMLPAGPCEHNFTLTRTKEGLYFFNFPISEKAPSGDKCKVAPDRIIGVDPGINDPFYYFSPDGEHGEIGTGMKARLNSFYEKERSIQLSASLNPIARKKALKKLEKRKMFFVSDFHWKVAGWFLDNFKTIIIPRLYASECDAVTKRHQNDIRHCLFVDRLIHKSRFYPDSRVHVGHERKSTMTCTVCGSIKTSRTDVVRCRDCGSVIHRNYAGARNIFLMHIE
jgi:transposase